MILAGGHAASLAGSPLLAIATHRRLCCIHEHRPVRQLADRDHCLKRLYIFKLGPERLVRQ